MTRRVPISERPPLFRDPADWARDHGWVSRRRALNIAAKLEHLAAVIEETLYEDDAGDMWARYARAISKEIAPKQTPAQRKRAREEKP